jgi:hypothetical protein
MFTKIAHYKGTIFVASNRGSLVNLQWQLSLGGTLSNVWGHMGDHTAAGAPAASEAATRRNAKP